MTSFVQGKKGRKPHFTPVLNKGKRSIGQGLSISHYIGIVISEHCVIGENFSIKQNVTIGVKHNDQLGKIYIGDYVEIGANSCIIGDGLHIGDNVTIGAMSFINKDIPSNYTVYTPKSENIKIAKKLT